MEHEEFNFTRPVMGEVDPLQTDWEALEDRASKVWNIPLRKKALFKLKGILKEFEGVIRVARRPITWDRRQKLNLRIGNTPFTTDDIEQFTVLNDHF